MNEKPNYNTYVNHDRYKSDLVIWQEGKIRELEANLDSAPGVLFVRRCDLCFSCGKAGITKEDQKLSLFVQREQEQKRTEAMNDNIVKMPEVKHFDTVC